jgi:hypothetical protein
MSFGEPGKRLPRIEQAVLAHQAIRCGLVLPFPGACPADRAFDGSVLPRSARMINAHFSPIS